MAVMAVCAPTSYACFCLTPEVPRAYDEADAVFIGEVAEIVAPRTDDLTAPFADHLFTVKFKVEKSWKGAGFLDTTIPEINVLADQGRYGCFSWGSFLEGRKYLVYATQTDEKDLAVRVCSRTVSFDNAADDLKELRATQNPFFKFERKRSFLERSFFEAHNTGSASTPR
jgi:hypothetical protein